MSSRWGGRKAQAYTRAVLAEYGTTCWLKLPGCKGVATTADHVIPRNRAPWLQYVLSNGRPACQPCNSKRGDSPARHVLVHDGAGFFSGEAPPPPAVPVDTARNVVLVCGAPGSGKSTHARTLGLPVYDMDDPPWCIAGTYNRRAFTRALRQLGLTPAAQGVVIRSGATLAQRARTAAQVMATDVVILTTPEDVCVERVLSRARAWPPMAQQLAAVRTWHQRYEPGDTPLPGNGPVF